MIAITTRSSTSVKPNESLPRRLCARHDLPIRSITLLLRVVREDPTDGPRTRAADAPPGLQRLNRLQTTRGGGASGAGRTQRADSSNRTNDSLEIASVDTDTGCGGGRHAPVANHSATIPPQASIARSVTVRVPDRAGSEGDSTGPATGRIAADSQQDAEGPMVVLELFLELELVVSQHRAVPDDAATCDDACDSERDVSSSPPDSQQLWAAG